MIQVILYQVDQILVFDFGIPIVEYVLLYFKLI